MTTAVMFRLVSGHSPTILADECDKWLFTNEELLGLVQSGHEKGGAIMRCEGDSNDLREFGCYAPFAMAAIGALPSQLHSRSICIRLERAKREEIEKRSRLDLEHVEYEAELNRKLARWTTDNRERIQSCDPKLPEHLFNRISDNWRPLFAIAEVAGGDWPRRCASALLKLTTREDDRESLRVMLLADIQQVFTSDRIFSKDLVELLAQMSERPWPEICRGRPINERWLARNLADFGIHSKTLRIGEERAKGYELSDFGEAFDRYLPVQGDFIRDSVTYEGNPLFSSVTKLEHVTDTENDSLIGKKGICHAVTLEKGGFPEKEGLEEPVPAAAAVEDTEGEL